jgi:signal transduction histidine kinase
MIYIYFLNGLSFGGLGLAALFQLRRGGDFPLRQHLPWLALYGFACGISGWIDMFLVSNTEPQVEQFLYVLQTISQPLIGLVLLIFGWRILNHLIPLPAWTMFIPVLLIVPIAFAIAYASTTFITPSPIDIPIDIWSRYFLYLPGSLMAGIGFMRQWRLQKKLGYPDVANLMLGTGIAFLFEAFVVGLVVPAAPYGPASYYNYDRVITNAFSGEVLNSNQPFNLMPPWLDYSSVLSATGMPIQFWRMLSTFAVTFFVVRGLDVFETIQRREVKKLQGERDQAQQEALESQLAARQTAENWTNALVEINRQIMNLENVDSILITITEHAKKLLHSDFIGLAIFNEDKSCLNLRYFSNQNGSQSVEGDVAVTNPLILASVQSGSYRSNGRETALEIKGLCFYCDRTVRSFAIVHLELDTVPVGALWLASFNRRPYTDTDIVWLESLADQVVIAIQHSQMTARLQTLSIIEERGRIARDMHDGVAQVLGYLNLQLQTLDALWKQNKKEAFEHELIQMRQAIHSANADVRESILSLRTTLANEKGLVAAMAEYIEEFGLQTGIDIHFDDHIQDEVSLSSLAEVQLVCILQEALANVRKHAAASHVDVLLTKNFRVEREFIVLQVSDDGCGFEMHESRRSFGLKTMGERANSVNGDLKVHSAPGHGTSVICTLPYLTPEKITQKVKVLP